MYLFSLFISFYFFFLSFVEDDGEKEGYNDDYDGWDDTGYEGNDDVIIMIVAMIIIIMRIVLLLFITFVVITVLTLIISVMITLSW